MARPSSTVGRVVAAWKRSPRATVEYAAGYRDGLAGRPPDPFATPDWKNGHRDGRKDAAITPETRT